jgi:hypothetical protein
MLAQGIAYLVVESMLVLLATAAVLRIGLLRLESILGVARDGLRIGTRAPRWELADCDDSLRQSPSAERFQILVFTDHSLKDFPRLAFGLQQVIASGLEAILLPRGDSELKVDATRIVANTLGVDAAIVPVDQAFYDKYNVRVLPFVTVVDLNGTVRAAGVVGEETQLMSMLRFARVPLDSEDTMQSVGTA